MGDIPRRFTMKGRFRIGPPLTIWQQIRWIGILLLAGRTMSVILNAEATDDGAIKVAPGKPLFMDGCQDVRLDVTEETGRQLYHGNPYNVTKERW